MILCAEWECIGEGLGQYNAKFSIMTKAIFKIVGMHCASCSLLIDGELEDRNEVEEAFTNYAKAETEVKFDPQKISPDQIIKIIKEVGYEAVLL